MNNGYLLICPDCAIKQVLGSVDANGAVHILRYKNKTVGMTTITGSPMTILCHCGFGTTIGINTYVYATPANA